MSEDHFVGALPGERKQRFWRFKRAYLNKVKTDKA
jgi:hypothetical protein